ncbi:hypothetical protein B0H19DRAFT_1295946 [Mycena capillaripes]|nr:hypothetical protein B0H19DRAFT_1295946 [Mycena capillaripes]
MFCFWWWGFQSPVTQLLLHRSEAEVTPGAKTNTFEFECSGRSPFTFGVTLYNRGQRWFLWTKDTQSKDKEKIKLYVGGHSVTPNMSAAFEIECLGLCPRLTKLRKLKQSNKVTKKNSKKKNQLGYAMRMQWPSSPSQICKFWSDSDCVGNPKSFTCGTCLQYSYGSLINSSSRPSTAFDGAPLPQQQVNFIVPLPRTHHGPSASAHTPPPYQAIQIPNAYMPASANGLLSFKGGDSLMSLLPSIPNGSGGFDDMPTDARAFDCNRSLEDIIRLSLPSRSVASDGLSESSGFLPVSEQWKTLSPEGRAQWDVLAMEKKREHENLRSQRSEGDTPRGVRSRSGRFDFMPSFVEASDLDLVAGLHAILQPSDILRALFSPTMSPTFPPSADIGGTVSATSGSSGPSSPYTPARASLAVDSGGLVVAGGMEADFSSYASARAASSPWASTTGAEGEFGFDVQCIPDIEWADW